MAYIADIILVAIFAVVIIISAHKGFFRSLIDFAGSIIAVFSAKLLSQSFAAPVYEGVLKGGIEKTLIGILGEGAATDYTQQLEGVVQSLPDGLVGVLKIMGVDKKMLLDKISSLDLNGENLIESLMNGVISPMITAVIQFVLFVILAILLVVAIKVLAKLLDKIIKKLPVIKSFNKTLGAVFGVLKGAIDVVIISLLISVVIGFVNNQELILAVNSSVIINTVKNIFTSLSGFTI